MHCENCKATPKGQVLETKSNKSDWNDWAKYYCYVNGMEKTTEFEHEFYCFDCYPYVKNIYVEDLSKYNER